MVVPQLFLEHLLGLDSATRLFKSVQTIFWVCVIHTAAGDGGDSPQADQQHDDPQFHPAESDSCRADQDCTR